MCSETAHRVGGSAVQGCVFGQEVCVEVLNSSVPCCVSALKCRSRAVLPHQIKYHMPYDCSFPHAIDRHASSNMRALLRNGRNCGDGLNISWVFVIFLVLWTSSTGIPKFMFMSALRCNVSSLLTFVFELTVIFFSLKRHNCQLNSLLDFMEKHTGNQMWVITNWAQVRLPILMLKVKEVSSSTLLRNALNQ